ncbi:four helix bundle protein [soil metagenome]
MSNYSTEDRNLDLSDMVFEESVGKYHELEERALQNAIQVRDFVKQIEKTIWNNEYLKQIVRSSASVGANYIEANEFLGEKDFLMKVKISRREAKETKYWLRLIDIENKPELESKKNQLIQEAEELRLILSVIINNRIKNMK